MPARTLLMTQPAAAGGGFDPETDITWHALYWAGGTDFTARGYSNGNSVATWDDEAGTNDLAQATGANQPTYSSSEINSRPAVTFDGSNHFLDGTLGLSANTDPLSVVAVVRQDVGASISRDYRLFSISTGASRYLAWLDNAASDGWAHYRGSAVLAGASLTTSPELLVSVAGGAAADLQQNGTSLTTSDPGSLSLGSPQPFKLGQDESTTSTRWNGVIAFLGIYDGDIRSDGAFADLESWVSSHYGITIA